MESLYPSLGPIINRRQLPVSCNLGSDYTRFYDTLAALPIVDATRILFHGRSLGGVVPAELSQHCRPAAVILESAFSSIKHKVTM
jgi:esterase/lipase